MKNSTTKFGALCAFAAGVYAATFLTLVVRPGVVASLGVSATTLVMITIISAVVGTAVGLFVGLRCVRPR